MIDARHRVLYRRLISLLHVPGDGPFVLRIGGRSSDRAFWRTPRHHLPTWAIGLTPAWLAQAAALVRPSHLRVILDLNLVTGSPSAAARWAREAQATLPPASLIGLEVGNEPDLYSRRFWRYRLGGVRAPVRLPATVTRSSCTDTYGDYASALTVPSARLRLLAPLLYGLILFKCALGPQAQLLAIPPLRSRALKVKVWAVRVSAHTLHVLLLDKGPPPLSVRLRIPARAPAHFQLLSAPAANATSGETIAAQHLDGRLRWRGQPVIAIVPARHGIYPIAIPRFGAALVSVPIEHGALPGPHGSRSAARASVIPTGAPEPAAVLAGWSGRAATGCFRKTSTPGRTAAACDPT